MTSSNLADLKLNFQEALIHYSDTSINTLSVTKKQKLTR